MEFNITIKRNRGEGYIVSIDDLETNHFYYGQNLKKCVEELLNELIEYKNEISQGSESEWGPIPLKDKKRLELLR